MGVVKRDIGKKAREYDFNYPYEVDGIHALLKDINKLSEARWYDGDIDATVLITDLKQALDNSNLTPRMRQVLALYYFADMTEQEVADVLSIDRTTVSRAIDGALERVSTFMEFGYSKPTNARTDAKVNAYHPFLVWVNEVASGESPIYKVPDSLTDWLAFNGDKKAQEVIRQRIEGFIFIPDYKDEEEYPALTEEQFRWSDRRTSFFPEIYPEGDVTGTRTVVVRPRDDKQGRDFIIEKRKIFKHRGN